MGKTVIAFVGLFIGVATLALLISPNGDRLVSTLFSGTNNLLRTSTAPAR